MTAAATTWGKAHDAYVETLLHEVALRLRRHDLRHTAVSSDGPSVAEQDATDGEGGAVRALDRQVQIHRDRRAELEAELASLGGPSGFASLRQATGLGDVETEAVALALAAELDAGVAHACAHIGAEGRAHVTPAVVAEVFERAPTEVAVLHASGAPCRRFRVFAPVGDELPASRRPLRLDGRVIDHLCGRAHVDERLAGIVEPLGDAPLAPTHRELTDQLVAWLTGSDGPRRPRINLVGPPGSGADAVAAAVARALGFVALRVHVERLVSRAERLDLVRLIDREAVLLPALVHVEVPDHGDDAAHATAAREVIDALGGVVVVASRMRWDGADGGVTVGVPALDAPERVQLWQQALGDDDADLHLAGLVEQFRLGPSGVRDAVGRARALRQLHGASDPPTERDLWVAARAFVGDDLGQLAQRITPAATWDELVLPAGEAALLRQIGAQVAQRPLVYEQWGFGARLTRGRGISALFTGPPGTGKTMAAEILAADLDLDLYRIDLSSVVSKYIGETERNLRRVFDAADAGGAILFFDEADALFGKRTEVSDSHDRYANVEVNYLLQRMEDYAGLAILATNRKGDLDPAFLRRIRFMVPFPFPDKASRRRIWQAVFPDDVPRGDLDLDALARLEIAGGNIRTIAVNATFLAADAGTPVTMRHVMRAARDEYRKLDKLPTATEFGAHGRAGH